MTITQGELNSHISIRVEIHETKLKELAIVLLFINIEYLKITLLVMRD